MNEIQVYEGDGVDERYPRIVHFCQARWQDLIAAVEAFRAQLAPINQALVDHLHRDSYFNVNQVGDNAENHLVQVASDISRRILEHAEMEFAPRGGHLKIDEAELTKGVFAVTGRRSYRNEDVKAFKPTALWEQIEERFGGSAGCKKAYRDAADAIIRCFNLIVPDASGRCWNDYSEKLLPRIARRFKPEAKYVLAEGPNFFGQQYSFDRGMAGHGKVKGQSEQLRALCLALETIEAATGVEIFGRRRDALHFAYDVTLRYGTKIQVSPSLAVILRKDRTEWRLSEEACKAIKTFVYSHHPDRNKADAS